MDRAQLVPLLPFVIPLATTIIAATAAVAGVLLTHRFTSGREQSARLAKEKRDAYVGALEAWRELKAVREEAASAAGLSKVAMQQLHRHRLERPNLEPLLNADSRLKEGYDEMLSELKKMDQENSVLLRQTVARDARARRDLDYWAARVELVCSEEGSAALKAFYEASPEHEDEARRKLIAAAKRDMGSPGNQVTL